MYCPKCSAENPDNAQICKSCSWVLTSLSATAEHPSAKTSGLAITALVLMILSFFTFFLTALPAVIFGIIALVKIEKSKGQLKGKGMAIAGIVAPVVLIPIIAMLMAILMPALAKVRQVAYRTICGANLTQLGMSMMMYADDYDGRYPIPSKWSDLLIEKEGVDPKFFVCKGAECNSEYDEPGNYAMNKYITYKNDPPDMVLLFETSGGWNQVGGPELITTENHQSDGCNVLFNDGHVEFVHPEDINDLRWMP